jgi:hypothetical protein
VLQALLIAFEHCVHGLTLIGRQRKPPRTERRVEIELLDLPSRLVRRQANTTTAAPM